MLPSQVAMYKSEDNIQKTEHLRKKNEGRFRQTESAHRMLKELSGMTLPIPMSSKLKWKLNKTHIKVAFRNCVRRYFNYYIERFRNCEISL